MCDINLHFPTFQTVIYSFQKIYDLLVPTSSVLLKRAVTGAPVPQRWAAHSFPPRLAVWNKSVRQHGPHELNNSVMHVAGESLAHRSNVTIRWSWNDEFIKKSVKSDIKVPKCQFHSEVCETTWNLISLLLPRTQSGRREMDRYPHNIRSLSRHRVSEQLNPQELFLLVPLNAEHISSIRGTRSTFWLTAPSTHPVCAGDVLTLFIACQSKCV